MPQGIYKHKRGKENHLWKGGLPRCFCGKELSARHYKFCSKHRGIPNQKEKNKNWKGGDFRCEKCNKLLSTRIHSRCRSHRIVTDEARKNMREARRRSIENGTWKNQFGGYKVDRSSLQRYADSNKDRRSSAYRDWRKRVWLRDGYACKIANPDCDGRIEAHHILGWSQYPELRYEVNNGITLCHFHHPRKRNDEIRLSPYFKDLINVKLF